MNKIKQYFKQTKGKIVSVIVSGYFFMMSIAFQTLTSVSASTVWYDDTKLNKTMLLQKVKPHYWRLEYIPTPKDEGFWGGPWNPLNAGKTAHNASIELVNAMFYAMYNGMWINYVNISYFIIGTFGAAYDLDIVTPLVDYISTFIQKFSGINMSTFQFSGGFFGNFFPIVLSLIMLYLLYYFATSKFTQFVKTFLITVLMLAFSMTFFGNSKTIITEVNNFTTSLNQVQLSIYSYNPNPNANTQDVNEINRTLKPSEQAQEMFLKILVKNPWEILNYGMTNPTGIDTSQVYTKNPRGEMGNARNKLIDEQKDACEALKEGCPMYMNQTERLWTVLLLFLGTVPLGFIVLTLSMSLMSAQLLFILLLLASPVVLLLAMIPSYNYIAMRWLRMVIATVVFKTIIGTGILIFCTGMDALYTLTSTMNVPYFFIILIQVYATRYISKNRKKIIASVNPQVQQLKEKLVYGAQKKVGTGVMMSAAPLAMATPLGAAAVAVGGYSIRKNADNKLKGKKSSLDGTSVLMGAGMTAAGVATANPALIGGGASAALQGVGSSSQIANTGRQIASNESKKALKSSKSSEKPPQKPTVSEPKLSDEQKKPLHTIEKSEKIIETKLQQEQKENNPELQRPISPQTKQNTNQQLTPSKVHLSEESLAKVEKAVTSKNTTAPSIQVNMPRQSNQHQHPQFSSQPSIVRDLTRKTKSDGGTE